MGKREMINSVTAGRDLVTGALLLLTIAAAAAVVVSPVLLPLAASGVWLSGGEDGATAAAEPAAVTAADGLAHEMRACRIVLWAGGYPAGGSSTMGQVTLDFLTAQLLLADQLHAGRETMFEPQDLPGRYGRVVKALDHLLAAIRCESVVGGGWAVWRHGFVGRVTQDIDIVLPAAQVDEFLQAASLAGFQVLPVPAGRWPKLLHRDTGVDVDILPEGQRPGTPSRPAPTTIPHPSRIGASGTVLRYASLPALIELKLAAGRTQDLADVLKLIQANPEQIAAIREHLTRVHADYVSAFDHWVQRASEEADSA